MKLKFLDLGSAQAAAAESGSAWSSALSRLTKGRRRAAHGERLREVLNRDRALAVSARVQPHASDAVALPCARITPPAPAELPAGCAPDCAEAPAAAANLAPAPEQNGDAAQATIATLAANPEQNGDAAQATIATLAANPEQDRDAAQATVATLAANPEQNGAVARSSCTTPDQNEEQPQRVAREPIRTRTMARLLAAQGYRQRALAIYDELLARSGSDEDLRAEADALRSRSG